MRRRRGLRWICQYVHSGCSGWYGRLRDVGSRSHECGDGPACAASCGWTNTDYAVSRIVPVERLLRRSDAVSPEGPVGMCIQPVPERCNMCRLVAHRWHVLVHMRDQPAHTAADSLWSKLRDHRGRLSDRRRAVPDAAWHDMCGLCSEPACLITVWAADAQRGLSDGLHM